MSPVTTPMTTPTWSRSFDARAWIAIVLAGCAAHGVLLFTDYLLWDGWWYAADIVRDEGAPTMTRLFHEVGRPLDMLFYQPLRFFGGDPVVWAKWLSVMAWVGSALCMNAVLRRTAGLPPEIATAAATIAVTLPTFDLLGELSLWMNSACVLLFWIAWTVVGILRQTSGWSYWAARLGAAALFFLSFNLNSNLVMFYAVAAALVGLRCVSLPSQAMTQRVRKWGLGHADFLVLPVMFWLWKSIFTPANGFYAEGYNTPSLEPTRFVYGYAAMVTDFLGTGFLELFASSAWMGVGVASAVAAGFLVARARGWNLGRIVAVAPWVTGWGIFVLAAAAFPYLAVGQALASEGWLSRNAILCNFPLALIIVGGLVFLNARVAPAVPWLWVTGIVVVAAVGVGACHRNYYALQAFGVKQRSVQRKLQAAIAENDACFVQLRDYYLLPGTISYYPPSIWTFVAGGTSSPPRAFVIDTRVIAPDQVSRSEQGRIDVTLPHVTPSARDVDQAIVATTMPYAMEGIPRSGPQILFAVQPGSLGNDSVKIGRRYVAVKFLDPTAIEAYENDMTETRVYPLPDIPR